MKAAVTVSSKGQIVLPVAIRKAAQVERGDLLLMEVVGDKIILQSSKKGMCSEAKKEKIKLMQETAGGAQGLDPSYVDELCEAVAKRMDQQQI